MMQSVKQLVICWGRSKEENPRMVSVIQNDCMDAGMMRSDYMEPVDPLRSISVHPQHQAELCCPCFTSPDFALV